MGQVLESVRELREIPVRPDNDALQFDSPAMEAVPSAARAEGTPRVRVKAFRLRDNTRFSSGELGALLGDGIGRDLTLADIEVLAARIGRYYQDRGYALARAYVPPQSIRNGEVEIAVAEGRLGKVIVRRGKSVRIEQEQIDRVLSKLSPGEPVHVPTVERALLLLTDMPGVSVKSTLQPGEASGTADLVVRVEEERMAHASFGLDNYGNRYTGTVRSNLNVRFNDLLGMGDQLSFTGVHSFSDLNSGVLGYELPLGGSGLRMKASYAKLHYSLGDTFSPLGISGDSEIFSLAFSYPWIRSRNANLQAYFGIDDKHYSERVEAMQHGIRKSVDNAYLGLSGSYLDGLWGGGASAFNAVYSRGHLRRKSADDATVDALTARTAGSFSKFNWQANRLQRLSDNLSLAANWRGQLASRNLDSTEKFYLGGPDGVRAYGIGEAGGDEGMLASLELRYEVKQAAPTQLVWFLDGGRVRQNKDPSFTTGRNIRNLSGTGIGINRDWKDLGYIRMSYARALSGEAYDSGEGREQFWVSMAMSADVLGALAGIANAPKPRDIPSSHFQISGTLNVDMELANRKGATAAGPRVATQSATPTGTNAGNIYRLVSNASNIRFRGEDNLGGGYKTWYQVESGASMDSGNGTLAGRNTGVAFVGRKMGTILLGQWDTPYKDSTDGFDPFDGNQVGAFYNILGSPGFGVATSTNGDPVGTANSTNNDDASFTRRQGNSLQYWSPEFGPFSFKLHYSGDGTKVAPNAGTATIWDAAVAYELGNLQLIAAYEWHENYYGVASLGRNNRGVGSSTGPTSRTRSRDDGLKLGARYRFPDTDISFVWERLRYRESGVIPASTVPDLRYYDRTAIWLGFEHRMGPFSVFGSYGKTSDGHCAVVVTDPSLQQCVTDGLGAQAISLGAKYRMSKRVALYAQYATIRNGAAGSYNFSTGYISGGGVGSDPQAFGLGMIYSF